MREEIVCRPIGVIRTPWKEPAGAPIQPCAAEGARGEVEVFAEYAEGLKDLDGFSHVVLLYHFHGSSGWKPLVRPYMEDVERGVFATRAPRRPNPIGLSVVRLVALRGNVLEVAEVDMLDGTPLLDVKPHVPAFAADGERRYGWLEGRLERARHRRADDRFHRE